MIRPGEQPGNSQAENRERKISPLRTFLDQGKANPDNGKEKDQVEVKQRPQPNEKSGFESTVMKFFFFVGLENPVDTKKQEKQNLNQKKHLKSMLTSTKSGKGYGNAIQNPY